MMVGVLVGSLVLGFPAKDGERWEVADEDERETSGGYIWTCGSATGGRKGSICRVVVDKGGGLRLKLGD